MHDPLLHGVPLCPPLRPNLNERCRPCGGRNHQALGVVQLVSLLPPSPGCLLAAWGGMVRRFSQGHGDAHPCIPQVCTEASLPPPSGGTGVCSSNSRPREVHQHCRSLTRKATLEVRTWVVWVVQMIHGTASLSWHVRKMHLIKSATEQLQG